MNSASVDQDPQHDRSLAGSPQPWSATTRRAPGRESGVVAALDVGGTKIAAGLVSSTGELLTHHETPTPADDRDAVGRVLGELVDRVIHDADGQIADVVGVGSAGPVNPRTGVVNPVNIPSLRGFPLAELVAERASSTSGRRVGAVVAQDGQCFAAAEQWVGAAAGSRAMMGVVVSTGIGAGIVLDGHVLKGKSGNAGFLSHVRVDVGGRLLRGSGALGAVEAYASGPSMVSIALERGWVPHGTRDARQLVRDAEAGVAAAASALDEGMRALAASFLSVAAVLDLEDIVIGGGVASAGNPVLQPLRRHYREQAVYPHLADVRITTSQMPRTAGLIGAGRLGWRSLATADSSAGPRGRGVRIGRQ